MTKGWRYESGRHALAARGIPTAPSKLNPRSAPLREARHEGEIIANDAFDLGGNKTIIEATIREMDERYGYGSSVDNQRVNEFLEENYDFMMDGIESDLKQTFREYMSGLYIYGGSIDDPWEDTHEQLFHAFINGYKNRMKILHEDYMRV